LKKGEIIADTGDGSIKGFTAGRLPSGNIVYGFRYRDTARKEHWVGLGRHGNITADEARERAKQEAGKLAFGRDPAREREAVRTKAAGTNTIDALLDTFVERYVRKNLRSASEIERVFNVYVRPRIGTKPMYELKRREVAEMLDAIENENGPVMAD